MVGLKNKKNINDIKEDSMNSPPRVVTRLIALDSAAIMGFDIEHKSQSNVIEQVMIVDQNDRIVV